MQSPFCCAFLAQVETSSVTSAPVATVQLSRNSKERFGRNLAWHLPSAHSGRSDLPAESTSTENRLKASSRRSFLWKSFTLPENLRMSGFRKLGGSAGPAAS